MRRGGEGDSVEKMGGDRRLTEEKEKEGVRLGLGDYQGRTVQRARGQ